MHNNVPPHFGVSWPLVYSPSILEWGQSGVQGWPGLQSKPLSQETRRGMLGVLFDLEIAVSRIFHGKILRLVSVACSVMSTCR